MNLLRYFSKANRSYPHCTCNILSQTQQAI